MADETSDIVEQMLGDNPPALIGIKNVIEHEDGNATYEFVMDEAAQKKLAEEGTRLVLHCAAANMELQNVYDWILSHVPKDPV